MSGWLYIYEFTVRHFGFALFGHYKVNIELRNLITIITQIKIRAFGSFGHIQN